MRSSVRLLQRVPLIKFVGGPHKAPKNLSHAPKPHPAAPNGLMPTAAKAFFNSNPIEPEEGVYFSRSELPKRFRYIPLKESEIEQVTSGGAQYVF